MRLPDGKYNLLVVAHPDDETIFFGGLLQRRKTRPWTVVCVTDGNADRQGGIRRRQFNKACSRLGIENPEWWSYPDKFDERLPVEDLANRLASLPRPQEVFTHGPLGEYEHPHHQDVSYAVHRAFNGHPRLYAVAYNTYPELRIHLSEEEYALKADILTNVYGTETSRFLNLLPATFSEGYLRLDPSEAMALYDFLARKQPINAKFLKTYRWLLKYLRTRPERPRPF